MFYILFQRTRFLLVAKGFWLSEKKFKKLEELFCLLPFGSVTMDSVTELCHKLVEYFLGKDKTAMFNMYREFPNPWTQFIVFDVIKGKKILKELNSKGATSFLYFYFTGILENFAEGLRKSELIENPNIKTTNDYSQDISRVFTRLFRMISDKRAQALGKNGCRRVFEPLIKEDEGDDPSQVNMVIPIDEELENTEGSFADVIRASKDKFLEDNEEWFHFLGVSITNNRMGTLFCHG